MEDWLVSSQYHVHYAASFHITCWLALPSSGDFICPYPQNHTFLSWKCFCPLILHFCYNHHHPCALDLSVSPSFLCTQQVSYKGRNVVRFKSVKGSPIAICSWNHGGCNSVHCWEKLPPTECYKQGSSKYLESARDSRVLLSWQC